MLENPTSKSVFIQYSLNWRTEVALLTLIIITSAIFLIFPNLDIWFSELFYDDDEEVEFWAREEPALQILRSVGPALVRLTVLACVFLIMLRFVELKRFDLTLLQPSLFLLSTLIIGPGIIVSAILKDNWGRPRPWMTESFGGDFPYVPVWEITDYCLKNCSFVSGEAASGIWLISVAFIVPLVWRKKLIAITLFLALVLSLNRIAFGGHFLSDTLLSWEITLLVVRLGFRLVYDRLPRFFTEERFTGIWKWFGN